MNFFDVPGVPDKKAAYFITSAHIPGAICPPEISSLDLKIRHHADLSICHIGKNNFVTAPEAFEYYKEKLKGANLISGITPLKSPYPHEAAYCAAVFGPFALGSKKVLDPVLLRLLEENFTFIEVSQGYTKCNLCPIRENAAITEDEGIYRALSPYIDVLLIDKGGVYLKGYDHGFFGGSTGMIDENTLFINGSLKNFPQRDKIYSFLEKYSVSAKELDFPITDVGSVIPIST